MTKNNPVDPKLVPHLAQGDVELLNGLELRALELTRQALQAYERGDDQAAEDLDATAEEAWEHIDNIISEVIEGGEPLTGGSETREGFSKNMTRYLAKIWGEYLRYQRTGWAMGGLDLSSKSKLAEHLRMVLRGDLKPSVTNQQLLEAAEEAYETLSPYFERGKATAQREDKILSKLGDKEAQKRVARLEIQQEVEEQRKYDKFLRDERRRLEDLRQRGYRFKSNPGGLQRRTARARSGQLFETGVPVTFRAMRNIDPSVWMGSRFGQDLEPAGTYMLLDDHGSWKDPRAQAPGWVFFEQYFSNPLVIASVADDSPQTPLYGPLGWKQRLSEAYEGFTGVELTRGLLASGHDGVVTVGPAPNDVREIVDLTRLPRSAALRTRKNPLDPAAWSSEPAPCALKRPVGHCPDDRAGVHFATDWGLAARYALFKASRSSSVGIILTYDLSGIDLVPDHDAWVEKHWGDHTVAEISYYIEEFDILADPENPDYDRLADLMEGEAEMHEPEPAQRGVEEQLVEDAKGSIFMVLANRLRGGGEDAERALRAIADADVPLEWWSEVIAQVRTFSEVVDERLLKVEVLKPVETDWEVYYGGQEVDETACPVKLLDEDMYCLQSELEGMAMTLWERPGADRVLEVHYHGTDLVRAEVILADSPAAEALHNPWDPCVQP